MTLLESVFHEEREGQWSGSPIKVTWPEGLQLDVLWHKHKLMTGEGQSSRSRDSEVHEDQIRCCRNYFHAC